MAGIREHLRSSFIQQACVRQMISEGMHDLNAIYYDKDFEGNQKEVGKPV